jgi:phytanoyl-CoA dioxygenase PhyH
MAHVELNAAGRPAALDPAHVAAFEERGHLRLRGVFPRDVALQMQRRMWDELQADFGIDPDDRDTWCQPRRSLRRAKWDPLQRAVATDSLVGAIDTLLGAGRWELPTNWGVVLVTFPDRTGGEWTLPTSGWHYDFGLDDAATSPSGLLVFTFFSSVASRGGGTLIVEGSHRLLRRFSESLSPDERRSDHQALRRRFLRHEPWLRALAGNGPAPEDRLGYFMGESRDVREVPVRVIELTGDPGDAILCHPLILHVAAPNRSDRPRFMRSQRICRNGGG